MTHKMYLLHFQQIRLKGALQQARTHFHLLIWNALSYLQNYFLLGVLIECPIIWSNFKSSPI